VSPKILLTGAPGVGKTTVIRAVAETLGARAAGFYTEETRVAGRRTGFDIVTLDGRRAELSRANFKSSYRVGKYGVDVGALDSVAVPAVVEAVTRRKIILIDEIGKMELFSGSFRESVRKAFDASNPVVAVIMPKPNPFADSLKNRPGVSVLRVTEANRAMLPSAVLKDLGFS
jgi:nucleoside-triphosphatase